MEKLKKIDYDNIRARAEAAGVCPYAWIKRELNFRESKTGTKETCWLCKSREPVYSNGENYQQCWMIGVSPGSYDGIDGGHVCDNFQLCHEKKAAGERQGQVNTNDEFTSERGDNG